MALAFALVSTLAAEPRFIVGVCTHFGQGKGSLPANLSLMRQAGVTGLRDEISWSGVERQKGRYVMPESGDEFVSRAVEAGIEPLPILDYGNRFYDNGDRPTSDVGMEAFTRYAEFVAGHFKGKVRMYEVWNEWDVYPRIKAVDRAITMPGGCPTSGGVRKGWLRCFGNRGA